MTISLGQNPPNDLKQNPTESIPHPKDNYDNYNSYENQTSKTAEPFMGFSKEDERLCAFLQQKPDSFQNNGYNFIQHFSFGKYQDSIQALIENHLGYNHTQIFTPNWFLQKIYCFLKEIELVLIPYGLDNQIISVPALSINDIQITGTKAWQLLLQHPEFVFEITKKHFNFNITDDELRIWIQECIAKHDSSQSYAGQETDLRIICSQAHPFEIAKLSKHLKNIFTQTASQTNLPVRITQYRKIDAHTTLVGFEVEGVVTEYIFTLKADPLSNATCSSISIIDRNNITFNCEGFGVIETLSVLFFSLSLRAENHQYWERLMGITGLIPMGRDELLGLEYTFEPLETVTNDKAFVQCLKNLGYADKDIFEQLKEGEFTSFEDKITAQYLGIIIRRRIKSKNDANFNALFVFHCCQCLQTYGKISDQAVNTLVKWLSEEKLLIAGTTHDFLKFFVHAIINEKVPFSVISAMSTLMAWFYQPEKYTQRQDPPRFIMDVPLIIRAPVDLSSALTTIIDYLKTNGQIEILKKMHAFFVCEQKNKECHAIICRELKISKEMFTTQINELLRYPDDFVNFLGMQMQLIFNPPPNRFYFLNQLSNLLKLEFKEHLKALAEQIKVSFQMSQEVSFDVNSWDSWMEFFINSNHSKLILIAHHLWEENCTQINQNIDFSLIFALSKVEPRLAIKVFTDIYPYSKFESKKVIELILKIANNFPIPAIRSEELLPLIKTHLLEPHCDFEQIKEDSFLKILFDILNDLSDSSDCRHILLILLLKRSFSLEEIPKNLIESLHPLSPFLSYRENQLITFSQDESEALIDLFDPRSHPQIPEKVLSSWIEMLSWIFYPNFINTSIDSFRNALETVTHYLQTEHLLTTFHQIYTIFSKCEPLYNHTDTCNHLQVDDLKSMQKLQVLMKHSNGVISHVSTQTNLMVTSWKKLNIFLIELPKLLIAVPKHLQSLNILFHRIAHQYHLNVQNFDPQSLDGWIKLLAQTKDVYLIDLAYDIWNQNQISCHPNSDLSLFHALVLCKSPLALQRCQDLYTKRRPPLDLKQRMTCLHLLITHLNLSLADLNFLLPFLTTILASKNLKNISDPLREIVIFFIKNLEKSASLKCLILQAFSKNIITLNDFSEHFEFILSIEKEDNPPKEYQQDLHKIYLEMGHHFLNTNDKCYVIVLDQLVDENVSLSLHRRFETFLSASIEKLVKESWDNKNIKRLQKLIQITPASSQKNSDLLKKLLLQLTRFGIGNLKPHDLNTIDSFLIKNQKLLFTINQWSKFLLKYAEISTSNDREHYFDLFDLLLEEVREENRLIHLLLQLFDHEYPENLSFLKREFLKNQRIIPILIENQNWQTAKKYIPIYNHYNIPFNHSIANIWQMCIEENQTSSLIELLEMHSSIEWKDYIKSNFDIFLEGLPSVIDQLILKARANDNKSLYWIKTFLENVFSHSQRSFSNNGITNEQIKNILPFLMTQGLSTSLKKFLFLQHTFEDDLSKQIIRQELENEIKSPQPKLEYCLNLTLKYFSSEISIFKQMIKKLENVKNSFLTERIIEELEKFPTSNQTELIECWFGIFQRLKELNHEKIWDYLHILPTVFHENKQAELREKAEKFLIHSALTFFAVLCNNKKTSIDLIENRLNLLIIKLIKSSILPSELYFSFFSLLNTSQIIKRPKDCLLILSKGFQNPTEEIRPRFFENFNTLLLYLESNFACLEAPDSLLDYKFLLESCMIKYLNISNPVNKHPFLIYQLLTHKFISYCPQEHVIQDTQSFESFLIAYQFLINYVDFKTPSPYQDQIVFYAIKVFHQIHANYHAIVIANMIKSEKTAVNELKQKCFLDLLKRIPNLILTDQPQKFDLLYFNKIFTQIEAITDANDYQFNLKKLLILRLIKKMQSVMKRKRNPDFINIRAIYEQWIETEFEKLYKKNDTVSTKAYKQLDELISFAKEANLYTNAENRLIIYSNLLELKPDSFNHLSTTIKNETYIEIINRLISYQSFRSTYSAITFFNKYIHFNETISQETRILIFKSLTNLFKDFFHAEINNQSFFEFIYQQRLNLLNKPENQKHFIKGGKFDSYLKAVEEIELKGVIGLIEILKKGDADFAFIAHNTWLAIKFLAQSIEKGYLKDNPKNYHALLSKLVNLILEIELKYFTIENRENFFKLPEPGKLINLFTNCCLSNIQVFNKNFTPSFYQLVELLLTSLTKANTDNNWYQLNSIFACIFVIFDQDNKNENYSLIKIGLDYLQQQQLNTEQQLYLEFIEFHCHMHLKDELNTGQKLDRFEFLCIRLKQISTTNSFWKSLYNILHFQITTYLSDNKTEAIHDVCKNFLFLHLEYFENADETSLKTTSLVIPSLIHTLIKYQLIDIHDPEFYFFLKKINEWFDQKKINTTPLELIELIIKFDQKDPIEFANELLNFIPFYTLWIRTEKQDDHIPYLTSLFNNFENFPNEKTLLKIQWDTCMCPGVQILGIKPINT